MATTKPGNAVRTATVKRRIVNRDRLEAAIVARAVRVFAESGYEGASIATVADNAACRSRT
jgi:TetR/AcrR family transcriptional regulator